jgi:recombinational DNA repair protein (RecF pathway)
LCTTYIRLIFEYLIKTKEIMKVLGFTDSQSECGRCGRTELKGTYAVEVESGEIIYLGSSCIAHRMELTPAKAKTFIKNEIRARKEEQKRELNKLLAPIQAEMMKLWDAPVLDEKRDAELVKKENEIRKEFSNREGVLI